jgi:hypothetical protein
MPDAPNKRSTADPASQLLRQSQRLRKIGNELLKEAVDDRRTAKRLKTQQTRKRPGPKKR